MNYDIRQLLKKRILILDGGLGTLIQAQELTPDDYDGHAGCNDWLCISRPDVIKEIHAAYLEAGADIVSTNTFNSNAVSLKDYGLQEKAYQINKRAAELAKEEAVKYSTDDKPRFVAGSVGPTNRTASISPDVNDPGVRNITFDELVEAYTDQLRGLIDGGADLILIETVFDTLNCKAALFALRNKLGEKSIPVMVSGTVTDASGRILSGQTVEAFYTSVRHGDLLSVGLNCAFGAKQLVPYLERLGRMAETAISAHPNAGLPNIMGGYDENPEQMAKIIEEHYLKTGLINIIGGCCGTTPEHIRLIAQAVREGQYKPRKTEKQGDQATTLAGLEVIRIEAQANFVNIGERTNVAGSAKFARLIREKNYTEALAVALEQVEGGAQIIDVCMDAPMIDARQAMSEFLNLMASEPEIARLPVMIDSSDWSVIEAGLKVTQGKSVVNSISLKEGETIFLERAEKIRSYGAAVVVMLFDEQGQAESYERKIEIAGRAYRLLTANGFPAEDIIFDPNILAIATGMDEHNDYGRAFIEACRWIKANCPGAKVSGGVSNLSFSFRGNNPVREAMHSVFLYHAVRAGMDMGIVNPSMLQIYDEIPDELRELAEDAVLNRRPDAGERMTEYASHYTAKESNAVAHEDWRAGKTARERVKHALIKGITTDIETDVTETFEQYGSALEVIDKVLMEAMGEVGERFGAGKMFLPQVVKSARVMKRAVEVLEPYIEDGKAANEKGARIVLATVKGDVHDIGKNIVSVVLSCNGHRITDLGVMVPPEAIVEAAKREKADIVVLSGLITPSLEEMRIVAEQFEKEGLCIPICVGGATTSELHTAVKITPAYSGVVAHSTDASRCARLINDLLKTPGFRPNYKEQQEAIREKYEAVNSGRELRPLEEARKHKPTFSFGPTAPGFTGRRVLKDYPLEKLVEKIDWTYLFNQWDLRGRYPEILEHPERGEAARRLLEDAREILARLIEQKAVQADAVIEVMEARSEGEDIWLKRPEREIRLACLRNQDPAQEANYSLADYVNPAGKDYITLFALGVNNRFEGDSDYENIMIRILCDRLAEAFAREIQELTGGSLRVAAGYPSMPDHSRKRQIFDLLEVEKEIPLRLTENYVMEPTSAVSGILLHHPAARYFSVGVIDNEQLADYARRTEQSVDELRRLMPYHVL